MSTIVLVIPTLKQGGAERVMSELANEWAEKGHDVNLVLLVRCDNFYVTHPNVKVKNLGFERRNAAFKVYSEIKTFFKLRQFIKSVKPDFVLSFMEKYNVLTLLSTRFLNVNVFVSDRSNPKKKVPRMIAFLRKKTYRTATGIIAQTSLAKEVLQQSTGNNNIRIIPNPIRKITNYPDQVQEKFVINVGRLVHEKGQKYLLEAFSSAQNEGWKLVILGEGPLRKELTEQAENLGLTEKILMPGSVSNVDEWLAKSSIFAFPSISEGFPNALAEAMAAGLPCVSFDCESGPKDIIVNNQNAFLVPVRNVGLFSEKLDMLMSDENLRESIKARAIDIAKDLEVSKIAERYLQFCLNTNKK